MTLPHRVACIEAIIPCLRAARPRCSLADVSLKVSYGAGMTPAQDAAARFGTLVEIMAHLRAPGGCPWDQKQTFDTIKPYLLEETYEVMDAI
jgi:hypothetical protein